jgi:hypothetical protein
MGETASILNPTFSGNSGLNKAQLALLAGVIQTSMAATFIMLDCDQPTLADEITRRWCMCTAIQRKIIKEVITRSTVGLSTAVKEDISYWQWVF